MCLWDFLPHQKVAIDIERGPAPGIRCSSFFAAHTRSLADKSNSPVFGVWLAAVAEKTLAGWSPWACSS